MSKAKFEAARELIQERRYSEARAILRTIDHPKAAEWVEKIDKLSPPVQPLPVIQALPPTPHLLDRTNKPGAPTGKRYKVATLAAIGITMLGVGILTVLLVSNQVNVSIQNAISGAATQQAAVQFSVDATATQSAAVQNEANATATQQAFVNQIPLVPRILTHDEDMELGVRCLNTIPNQMSDEIIASSIKPNFYQFLGEQLAKVNMCLPDEYFNVYYSLMGQVAAVSGGGNQDRVGAWKDFILAWRGAGGR